METNDGVLEYVEMEEENRRQYYAVMAQSQNPSFGYAVDPRYYSANEMMQSYYHHLSTYPYGYQYPLQHMEGVPLPPGIPGLGGSTDPMEAVLGPFPCARLFNLPYDVSIEDILTLFQGLVVIDVVLATTSEAFVVFANPMDYQMALQRNRHTISRRMIEVSPATRAEYYEAIANQHIKEQDSRPAALQAGSMTDEGMGNDPMTSGDVAGVDLWGQPAGGTSSLQSLTGQSVYGDGMVRGVAGHILSTRGGGSSRGGLHAPPPKRTGGGIQVGEHTGFLRMRGLPFQANRDEILNFFEGYNAVPESIVLTYRNDGRATGEAYVGFSSPEDSRRAMELHRRIMGSRYIELFISNREEQGRALARFGR